LPAFALAFVLILGIRAVTLIAGDDGRYFTGGDRTELKLTDALRRDLPEHERRSAAFDPDPQVAQRILLDARATHDGKQGWRWQFNARRPVRVIAAGFPDAVAALERGPLLVVPDEHLGAFVSVRVSWPARPPTAVEVHTRFFDARGHFVSDMLAGRLVGPRQLRRGHWRTFGGPVQAPDRAASAALLVLVRFPPTGATHHVDVDGGAVVPGARTGRDLIQYVPGLSGDVWGSAIPRALSLALAMLLCVLAGYLLPGRRGLAKRRLPVTLADLDTRAGRRLLLAVVAIGVAGWIWEMAGYGGYGAYLDQLHTAGVTGRGHWYQHTVALLPTGLAVLLTVRWLADGWRRPRWWEALTIAIGAAIGLSYLLKATVAIPALTALVVLCMRRPRVGLWIVASGALLALLTPFVYAVRGAGRIEPSVLFSSSYWTDFLPNLASRFFHFESLMISTQHAHSEHPWRPLADLIQTAIPRAIWEGKPDSMATRFTQEHLLSGLHAPTDIGVLSAPGEAYLVGGAAGIILAGLAIGLLLRVARDLVVAAPSDLLTLLVAATLIVGLVFANDGWGIASTVIVLGIAQLGWLVMVRPRRRGRLPPTSR
ncbi:MAG TPA: hypothetical protein VFZ89_07805, partial [Solirubrobacteraceae bacterium]